MKVLKINNKDYVLKFTTKSVMNLNAKNITLTSLSKDMEVLNVSSLYEAFCEGLRFGVKDINIDEACKILDEYYAEGNEVEELFMLVLEEYAKSMGLAKKFKELIQEKS